MKALKSLIILLTVILSVFSCKEEVQYKKTENIQVIPQNAALIVEGRNLKKTKKAFEEMEFSKLLTNSNKFNSFFESIDQLNNQLDNKGYSLWGAYDYSFSMHPTGAKKFGQLFILDNENEELWQGVQSSLDTEEKNKITYDNQEIISLKKWNLYLTQIEKYFILSNEEILLKDAIRQYSAENDLTKDLQFQKAFQSADRSEVVNIYLQTEEGLKILNMTYGKTFEIFSGLEEWVALDLQMDSKTMLWSGISTVSPKNDFFFQFQNQGKTEAQVANYLPSNTQYYVSYLFPEFNNYLPKRLNVLERNLQFESYRSYRKKHKVKEKQLAKSIDNEFSIAYCGNTIEDQNKVGLIKLKDAEFAPDFLNASEDIYREVNISSFKNPELLYYFFGSFFKSFKSPKAIVLDEFLIVSDEIANLKAVVNDYKADNVLSKQEAYNQIAEELNTNTNVQVYISDEALKLFPMQMANDKNKTQQKEVGQSIQNLGKVMMQISAEDDYLQINLANKNPKVELPKEETKLAWSLSLEAKPRMAPQIVKNHQTKEREIAIQDKNNILYLISQTGKILWKKELPKPILGNINQIDIYKNGRLQLLFNTEDNLYLLDRNGKKVKGYPVNLPSQAQAGHGLFDYDRNKNYRILVPCEKNLAMYDAQGKPVKGWKAWKQNTASTGMPQHLREKGKDYLLIPRSGNKVSVLNRVGKTRIKVNETIQIPDGSMFTLSDRANVLFEILGKEAFYDIRYNGSVKPRAHGMSNIFYHNKHGKNIYLSNKKLFIGKEVYEFENELLQSSLAVNSKNNFFAVNNPALDEIYLIDTEGSLKDGFPVFGNTAPGIISSKNHLLLISGASDGTLYGYRVRVE
ncbi:MAG: hypothetical protein N4A45_03505 [Flavobacteriales bacterium]|jgi:hypothetical protein|nr:hypothetical protein [Flavobacteriales bacterium]